MAASGDGIAHALDRIEMFPVSLPYRKAIKWASVTEAGADYLVLRLTTKDGVTGIAEGTIKPTWTGATFNTVMVAITELFLPRIGNADLSDPEQVYKLTRRLPGHDLAKAMIDMACWDIRAQIEGKPLWKLWGGGRHVRVSSSVTRQAGDAMAEEAQRLVETQGVDTLKLKGGQGMESDEENVAGIRKAVGNDVTLYVDCNRAYAPEDAPPYTERMASHGVRFVEDPCPLEPTERFSALQRDCALPLIVDSGCTTALMARLYAANGARSIVLKPGKTGFTEAFAIAAAAARTDTEVHISVLGGSSLGSFASLQLAAALATRNSILPAEATFFLQLKDEFVHEPCRIENGAIELPEHSGLSGLVDWTKLHKHQAHAAEVIRA